MTYNPGDPGHMKAHTDLVAAVNTELIRFGIAGDIPSPSLGDEGHLDDTNAITAALSNLETVAGQTYTLGLPPTRALGDPGHTTDHELLDAAVAEAATWPAWNDATGGTLTEVDDYNGATGERWRIHRFDSAGSLDVSLALHPFSVLVVGGGNDGGGAAAWNWSHAGGDGAFIYDAVTALALGSHSVTIGGASNGTSSLGALTSVMGTRRANGGGTVGTPSDGRPGGDGLLSTITGTPTHYGGGGGSGGTGPTANQYRPGGAGGAGGGGNGGSGGGSGGGQNGFPGTANTGGGGGGGGWNDQGQRGNGAGGSGVVIVAYQIG